MPSAQYFLGWRTFVDPGRREPEVSGSRADYVLPPVGNGTHARLSGSCVEALSAAIAAGTYPPASRLPSEERLATTLRVSRVTVREALRVLEERGLIQRRHGRGTFVAERPIRKDLNRNFGITSMIQQAGYRPGTKSLSVEVVRDRPDLAERLQLHHGAELLIVTRLRLADSRPVIYSTEALSGDVLPSEDLRSLLTDERQSLYGLLYQHCRIVVYRGMAELYPEVADRELAELLGVRRGAPLLRIDQVDYGATGEPVLYSTEHHVAGWVRFSVERFGPGSTADV